jgi:thiamine-phosphate pyrophosphorylase
MSGFDITLYAILDPAFSRGLPLPEMARAAAAGGITLLQYRDKLRGAAEQVEAVKQIRSAMALEGVPVIVNDHPEIARAAGADGVHLGSSDMAPDEARRLLGADAIIGLTVKTVEEAQTIPLDNADYVFVGGVFETGSKHNPVSIGLDGWRRQAAILRDRRPGLPIGAIAGIDRDNADAVIGAGADGIAVISAIFAVPDIEGAARALRNVIGKARQLK